MTIWTSSSCYSSASAVLGSPSQANYACANALLDGLVAHRRALGLQATAANFGPWGHGGMASSQAALANLSAQGMMPLEPSAALAALGEVVRHGNCAGDSPQGQLAAHRENARRHPPAAARSGVAHRGRGRDPGTASFSDNSRRSRWRSGSGSSPSSCNARYRVSAPRATAASSRFLDLGTDSLMAVELRNRLFGQFGGKFDISPTAVFDYPTIGELAAHLVSQLPDSEPLDPGVPDEAARGDGAPSRLRTEALDTSR